MVQWSTAAGNFYSKAAGGRGRLIFRPYERSYSNLSGLKPTLVTPKRRLVPIALPRLGPLNWIAAILALRQQPRCLLIQPWELAQRGLPKFF